MASSIRKEAAAESFSLSASISLPSVHRSGRVSDVLSSPQAWLRVSSTRTQPGGGGRNGDLILQKTRASSSLLSSQVPRQRARLALNLIRFSATCLVKLQDTSLHLWWKKMTFMLKHQSKVLSFDLFFTLRIRFGVEEGRPAVVGWQQLGGLAEGGTSGQTDPGGHPGVRRRLQSERLHRQPELLHPD